MQKTKKLHLLVQGLVLAGITGLALFGLFSFTTRQLFGDFWEQLGVTQQRGSNSIKSSFLNGSFYHPNVRVVRSLAAGDRVAVAKDLLAYTKEYVNTPAFAQEYEQSRQSRKPTVPEPAKTEAVIRQKFIDDTKKGIENMEKFIKVADASMKKTAEEGLAQQKAFLKDYQDPNSEMIKMAVQGEQIQFQSRQEQYEQALKDWQTNYPANVKAMIKVRLQHMLAATKDVDFAAQTVERDGLKRFVKQEYENKSAEWKKAYRAGKDVTVAAQAFARQWLQELP
ncbi:hypothetical protein [Paraflavitalea pollutisoli]|uniref:hypothetical protein n=1 Tax=Paraflavitalea pollutisoli TaxID=3034143 RepID=UPI0023EDDB0A|nr:hypothetical protein [Paraflavitalea sp. H1-2-19X]